MDGVLSAAEAALSKVCECVRALWRLARDNFHCPVIQQLPMPSHPPLVGNNEHRLPGSRAIFLARLAAQLRQMGDAEGVDLLALDARVGQDGLADRRIYSDAEERNGRDDYGKLGFAPIECGAEGSVRSLFDLSGFVPRETFIEACEG